MFVSTLLTLVERGRVDAIAAGEYDIAHRDSIDEVVSDVRVRRAQAAIISIERCHCLVAARIEATLSSMISDFPGVPALALLSEGSRVTLSAVLLLGRTGIRTVVDGRTADGWRRLRQALATRAVAIDIETAAVAQLTTDLSGAPPDCRRFFLALFSAHEPIVRVDQLGQLLAVLPSTLISRFARGALPSPKVYLSWARLVRAASLLEEPGASVSGVAIALDYSSPQAFSRHVELQTGLTVPDFRRTHDGRAMLARFREELVLRYMGTLRTFSPLGGTRDRRIRELNVPRGIAGVDGVMSRRPLAPTARSLARRAHEHRWDPRTPNPVPSSPLTSTASRDRGTSQGPTSLPVRSSPHVREP
jgi:AraC-like DNA-binding protein